MIHFSNLQHIHQFDYQQIPSITIFDPTIVLPTFTQIFNLKEKIPKLQQPTAPSYFIHQYNQNPKKSKQQIFQSKNKKGLNKIKLDEDYKPYRRSKITAKAPLNQKKVRNTIPNTVHHLLTFIRLPFRSKCLTQHIFQKTNKNEEFTVHRFYTFQKMVRMKINNYVNEDTLKTVTQEGLLDYELFSQQQQKFYCYVSRILAKKFLKNEGLLLTLSSQKVRKQNRLQHLSVQRYLYENMSAFTFK